MRVREDVRRKHTGGWSPPPPRSLSRLIRRAARRRYGETRAAHRLLLIAADRVDAWESRLRSFATLRPDNPLTETGVRSELIHHGLGSRLGTKRADRGHQRLDPVIVAGPRVSLGGVMYAVARRLAGAAARGDRRGEAGVRRKMSQIVVRSSVLVGERR